MNVVSIDGSQSIQTSNNMWMGLVIDIASLQVFLTVFAILIYKQIFTTRSWIQLCLFSTLWTFMFAVTSSIFDTVFIAPERLVLISTFTFLYSIFATRIGHELYRQFVLHQSPKSKKDDDGDKLNISLKYDMALLGVLIMLYMANAQLCTWSTSQQSRYQWSLVPHSSIDNNDTDTTWSWKILSSNQQARLGTPPEYSTNDDNVNMDSGETNNNIDTMEDTIVQEQRYTTQSIAIVSPLPPLVCIIHEVWHLLLVISAMKILIGCVVRLSNWVVVKLSDMEED